MIPVIHPTFQHWPCENQRVFLRADLNVPLIAHKIHNDWRLQALRPTLDALLAKKAIVVLITHLGRPQKQEEEFSTRHLIPWFEQQGYTITFVPSFKQVRDVAAQPGSILLTQNIRFYDEEKKADPAFAMQLAQLAAWYVNDAFGVLHRDDTSLRLLAEQYQPDRRSIGYLIEKELSVLNELMVKPRRPLCMILGGGKITDKLPLIENFIDKADTLLLNPAIVFTFLKSQQIAVGQSLVDDQLLHKALTLLQKAAHSKTQIVMPIDFMVSNESQESLYCVDADRFPEKAQGISIGPKTMKQYKNIIEKSATIFINGLMGFSDKPSTLDSMKELLTFIAQSNTTSIVAGGDTISLVEDLSLQGITYCSTGGGSTLAYLGGKPLPGLQPFISK